MSEISETALLNTNAQIANRIKYHENEIEKLNKQIISLPDNDFIEKQILQEKVYSHIQEINKLRFE